MPYDPRPVDTSAVNLEADLLALIERLAANTHDVWARKRLAEGWTYGPHRDDAKKHHPCLVPYDDLAESEKEYDRQTALETIKLVLALGYAIRKPATGKKRPVK